MSRAGEADPGRPDLMAAEGFIARAYDDGGLKQAVKEAEKFFKGQDSRDVLNAAASMRPKVRTAVMKMVNLRRD